MPDFNTSIHDYDKTLTQKVETALLDIWGRLGEYRQYLVLIGGLAPRYITAPTGAVDYSISSHCGTMDIDFGVSIALSDVEKYKSIEKILKEAGYRNRLNKHGNKRLHSFVKRTDTDSVVIDFLTTTYSGPDNSLMHRVTDELSAIQTRGLGLALSHPLKIRIQGTSLSGDIQEEVINVCRAAAYIPLKALAYDGRRNGKDVYDLVYVLENYLNGVDSVVDETTEEDFASQYFKEALECLSRHFRTSDHIGPAAYANFCGRQQDRLYAFSIVQEYLEKIAVRFGC